MMSPLDKLKCRKPPSLEEKIITLFTIKEKSAHREGEMEVIIKIYLR